MAAITWYLTNASVSVGSDLSTSDPGAEATRSPVTGWIVGTGATLNSAWFNDVERGLSTFIDTVPPSGTLDTTNGDFWVSPTALNGTFDGANWSIHFACIATTNGGAQDGRMRCRLFKGVNQNGTSATEITAAQQSGGLVTNLATSASQLSTATFNPGAISLSNEYIFVQIGWERTGAGGMVSADVNARIGGASSCRVITSNFTSAALTGTITAGVTEEDIVAGGKTLIITLTGDTWIAAGAASFDLQRQNIINGCTSAQSEALGWNLVPKALQGVTGVVRTSDTVVTITWDAFATYDITATETITVTVPATALVLGDAVIATPTFSVTALSSLKSLCLTGVGA